jgi:hypothetical protein
MGWLNLCQVQGWGCRPSLPLEAAGPLPPVFAQSLHSAGVRVGPAVQNLQNKGRGFKLLNRFGLEGFPQGEEDGRYGEKTGILGLRLRMTNFFRSLSHSLSSFFLYLFLPLSLFFYTLLGKWFNWKSPGLFWLGLS